MTVDFCDYFWGEKNNGFDVLYQNTKHGQNASKELTDFFKERAMLEESYSKMLAKLANKAGNAGVNGTFGPVWALLRTSSEKLSSIHLAAVTRLNELVKEVQKFSDDLHKRQKTLKEEESPTMEVVASLQQLTSSVLKARELYQQRGAELRKLQEAAQPGRDTDKAEAKLRKAAEEYRSLVDKYKAVREDFERKMVVSCRHFQELEENYLCQMKEFLDNYIKIFDGSTRQIRDVNVELRSQCDEKTVIKLLEEFALAKHTGLEKPALLEFEELPAGPGSGSVGSTPDAVSETGSAGQESAGAVSSAGAAAKQGGASSAAGEDSSPSSSGAARSAAATPDGPAASEPAAPRGQQLRSSKWDLSSWQPQGGSWTSGFLRGRRGKRDKQSKKRDAEKSDSEENHTKASPVVDEEGYSIRPRLDTEKKKRHDSFYSSSDSDSDEDPTSKIHVKINPLSNGGGTISASVDELRTLASGLTLSPANTGSSKSPTIAEENNGLRRSQSVSQQIGHERPSNDLIGLSFHSPTQSNQSTPSTSGPRHIQHSASAAAGDGDRYAELSEIFAESSDMPPALPPKHQPPPTPQRGATPTLSSIAIPRPPSRRSIEGSTGTLRGRQSPSVSSPISRGPTPVSAPSGGSTPRQEPAVGTSRGPSPLTLGLSDTVPLAVAFQEVVHAYFRGSDPAKCQVKMTGDTMVSFPSGIVQVLTSNPSPAPLVFRLKNTARMESMLPNKHLITQEPKLSTLDTAVFEFRMDNLTALLRKQAEKNPSASYFNVDILKYQIRTQPGTVSVPLKLVAYWKCEPTHTDLKVEYRYNGEAMTPPSALQNVTVAVPVDGGVTAMHSKPSGKWVAEANRAMWRIPEVSGLAADHGTSSLKGRFELSHGPGNPSTLAAQFSCEGSTLSGAEFQLLGSGYRVSLVKRRFVSGKYICDSDYIESSDRYAAPPGPG